ncbi:hypothetical protein [Jiella avicenniae]|uniref:Uncharacterized protein n=1 Tax=Jiella avicenniae TaxID=2907202 RepID=A0A9X1P561_9HYPH|nr:hypothetical protein [Jiella avicenniae]MCE7030601.1 hypothetical protein [Jiella avicenniae]
MLRQINSRPVFCRSLRLDPGIRRSERSIFSNEHIGGTVENGVDIAAEAMGRVVREAARSPMKPSPGRADYDPVYATISNPLFGNLGKSP